MKRNRLLVVGMVICVIATSSACGGSKSATPATSQTDEVVDSKDTGVADYKPAKDAIKVEEIEWTVTPGLMDGERMISFDYTNNSKYTIMDVELDFVQKEGITEEQYKVFDEIKETYSYTDDEVKDIYILGYNRKFADPGETVTDSPCVINGTYIQAQSMEQYELMEPEMMTIAYIGDDGKGYAEYYDYKTNAYGDSSNGGNELKEWSDSEISKMIPEPDSIAINVSSDDEDRFFFSAYGVSTETYKAYVEEVKAKGFTDVQFEGDTSYRALNSEGFEMDVYNNPTDELMTGCIEGPTETGTQKEVSEAEDKASKAVEEAQAKASEAVEEAQAKASEAVAGVESKVSEVAADGIRPEFKEAMDSYEKFFDEYCEFIKKYNSSSNPTSLMSDYMSYMQKYSDAVSKINEIGNEDMSNEELKYYSDVTNRINQKLIDAAQ